MISAIANIAIHFKMGCIATLMGVAHDGLKLPPTSAILARQAAKFILDAERSIVHSFCQKLIDAIQNIIDRAVVRKSHHI